MYHGGFGILARNLQHFRVGDRVDFCVFMEDGPGPRQTLHRTKNLNPKPTQGL